jgi:hypothetical protein
MARISKRFTDMKEAREAKKDLERLGFSVETNAYGLWLNAKGQQVFVDQPYGNVNVRLNRSGRPTVRSWDGKWVKAYPSPVSSHYWLDPIERSVEAHAGTIVLRATSDTWS